MHTLRYAYDTSTRTVIVLQGSASSSSSSPETPAKYDISNTMGTSGTRYSSISDYYDNMLCFHFKCSVLLKTNYIALQTKTEGVYQYAVSFEYVYLLVYLYE